MKELKGETPGPVAPAEVLGEAAEVPAAELQGGTGVDEALQDLPAGDELPELTPAVPLPADEDIPPPHEGMPFFMAGRTWIVPPLNLGQARVLQGYILGVNHLRSMDRKFDRMLRVVMVAMQRNYPSLVLDHVQQMLDMGNVADVFQAVLGQSGYRERAMRKEAGP